MKDLPMDADEVWKPSLITDRVEVSSLGRVRTLSRRACILKQKIRWGEYLTCTFRHNGLHTTFYVHSLVAGAFVGPRPRGLCCNHKNGVKTDNRATNLEWVTPKQNIRHAHEMGLGNTPCGERNGTSKLKECQVKDIRARRSAGERNDALAAEYGVTESTISSVFHKMTWRHI